MKLAILLAALVAVSAAPTPAKPANPLGYDLTQDAVPAVPVPGSIDDGVFPPVDRPVAIEANEPSAELAELPLCEA